MTEYRIKTTVEEADLICADMKRHIYRTDKIKYFIGDIIKFEVIDNLRRVPHKLDRQRFVITYVDKEAPINKGVTDISFRRMS